MTTSNAIPFLDLVTPHTQLKEELLAVCEKALSTAGFIGGPMVEEFEREFAAYCEAQHCVGVGNGTDALRFALIAAGIQQGDLVLTVPNTFIATTEAISQSGATPRFVDVDEATYNMDPEQLRKYLTEECSYDSATRQTIERKTGRPVTAVIPVHLYGQMADMDPIVELTEQYNLVLIEDACQAHGAEYFSKRENRWQKAGSIGRAAAFSFYPGKNLGACGEAGAVTTNDAQLAKDIRMVRDHGQNRKYYHQIEGYNGRLDAMQAGFLRVKLRHLPEWTEQRQAAATRYRDMFASAESDMMLPHQPDWTKPVYHLFVVRVQNREELMKQLAGVGIGTAIHYPIPLHLQQAYESLGYEKGAFPVAEKVAPEILSLPMFPQLTADQQSRVVDQVVGFVEAGRKTLAIAD
jgi:dTDP-4-amino-4,6-dideoxygalactose transaminase